MQKRCNAPQNQGNAEQMSSFAERLKRALYVTDTSQAELARTINIRQQGVHYLCHEAKGSKHSPAIARALGISLEWLTEGRGEMFDNQPADKASTYDLSAEAQQTRRAVPLISWVQAGQWSELVDNFMPGDAAEWLDIDFNASPYTFALTVRGDSMAPEFHEGARIIIDPAKEALDGSFVVARLDDAEEATFKQLVVDGPQRYLKPLNPRYPIIEANGNMTICGVVRAQSKRYE